MSLAQSILRDLQTIERDLAVDVDADGLPQPQTFTWRNKEIPCVPGARSRGTTVAMAGFEVEFTMLILVRLAHFLTADTTLVTVDSDLFTADSDLPRPVAGLTLRFLGMEYKIIRTRILPARTHVELYLSDVNA
jgi:hypothetical protein